MKGQRDRALRAASARGGPLGFGRACARLHKAEPYATALLCVFLCVFASLRGMNILELPGRPVNARTAVLRPSALLALPATHFGMHFRVQLAYPLGCSPRLALLSP